MRQRGFFKKETVTNGAIYAAQRVAPGYNRYYERIKILAEKSPKKTAILMLLFAFVNVVLMLYIVYTKPPISLIPKNITKAISITNERENNTAAFSLSNYLKISKLKDSLDYLMKLPTLTKSDSLLFIRICDQYTKFDPTFFRQVNEAIHKKHNNSNYEKFNH